MSTSPPHDEPSLVDRLPVESAFIALTSSDDATDGVLCHLLEQPIQWESLLSLAARERAIVPLSHKLQSLRSPSVPAEVRSRLDRFAMISEFQLVSLHERLGRILALLSSRGIDALLLKGAGLAYSAYARPTDRPMGDIDLLVAPERAAEAWELVLTDGWVRRRDISLERSYEDHQHLPPLEDADGMQMGLELHTALFTHQAPFRLPASQIWDGARRIPIGAQSALVPSVEDQLLHASLHFAWSHELTFGAWRTLRDVERITLGDVHWEDFIRKADASRGATCCFWTLRLARDITDANVPDEVLERLAPPLPSRVLKGLTQYFAAQAFPVPGTTTRSVSLSRALWSLAMRPRAQGHGSSRPWLDTEDWVRDETGMKTARPSPMRRFLKRGAGLLRMVVQLTIG